MPSHFSFSRDLHLYLGDQNSSLGSLQGDIRVRLLRVGFDFKERESVNIISPKTCSEAHHCL